MGTQQLSRAGGGCGGPPGAPVRRAAAFLERHGAGRAEVRLLARQEGKSDPGSQRPEAADARALRGQATGSSRLWSAGPPPSGRPCLRCACSLNFWSVNQQLDAHSPSARYMPSARSWGAIAVRCVLGPSQVPATDIPVHLRASGKTSASIC